MFFKQHYIFLLTSTLKVFQRQSKISFNGERMETSNLRVMLTSYDGVQTISESW